MQLATRRGPRRRWERPPPRVILWITVGLFVGQASAVPAPGRLPEHLVISLAVPCLIWWRLPAASFGLALAAAVVGHQQMDRRLRPQLPRDHIVRLAGQTVRVRGRVMDRPSRQPHRTRLTLEVDAVRRGETWQARSGRVQVTIREAAHPWRRGEELEAAFRLRRPRNFGNPDEFDYESFLARRRIYVTGYASSDRGWVSRAPPRWFPFSFVETWREDVRRDIDEQLAGPARQIVAALLIGDGSSIAPEVRERYARTGLSHVLAISGLHIGLVAGAAYALFRWLLARSEWLLLHANVPKLAKGLTILPVLIYAGIAGGNVPTLRALVMIAVVLTGTTIDRPRDWLVTLAAAALLVGLLWPGSLFEVSFQLSFVAVAAIVLGTTRIAERWSEWEERRLVRLRRGPWAALRWLVFYQAATLCATLGTAPLAAWHFNRVSLISLVTNLLIVPLLGLLPVGAGLIAVLLQPLSPGLTGLLLATIGILVSWADRIVGYAASLPGASIRVATPSLVELALLYAMLAACLMRRARPRRLLLAALALLLALDAGYWIVHRYHRRDLRLTFLSVGQGDSTLVEFPGSAVMVVDGGGLSFTFDVGERIVAPQLWRRKIGRIDQMVLTHPQFDHYGGLTFLAGAFATHELWWNGSTGRGRSFEELWQVARRRGVSIVDARAPFHRVIGGVEVDTLFPNRSDPVNGANPNDESLTLRLRYGPTTVLLPGDLEQPGERRLLHRRQAGLRSSILKVPHHGSRTSSSAAFLAAVAPPIAVASLGYQNRFGMPHPEVIRAYRRIGSTLWRTDADGAVVATIARDGQVDVVGVRSGRSRVLQLASE